MEISLGSRETFTLKSNREMLARGPAAQGGLEHGMNWSYWDIAHLQWGWKLLQTGRSLASTELQRTAAAAATLHQRECTSLGSDKFTTEAFFFLE